MPETNGSSSITVKIVNKLGLHARASAKFVSQAARYACNIEVSRGDKTVNGKSIMGVMMLAASKGTELTITATGADATQALQDLDQLVADRFGEDD